MEVFNKISFFVLFASFYVCLVQAQINVYRRPENTAAKVGQPVQLNCSTTLKDSQTLQWRFNPTGSQIDENIVRASPLEVKWETGMDSMFNMDTERNLIFRNFDHNRAGRYTCHVTQQSPLDDVTYSAEVIALGDLQLGTDDDVEGVLDGEEVNVVCAVNISGVYNPRLRMFKENEELETSVISNPTVPDGEYRLLKYGYNFTAMTYHNDVEFKCDLMFTTEGIQNPTYVDLTYFNFTVYHGVVDIDIQPNSDNGIPTVEVGEHLNCSARGEPEPEYRWTNRNSSDVRSGSLLAVTRTMIGRNEYTCTAYNIFNGTYNEMNKTVIFNAVEAGTGGSQTVLPSFALSVIFAIFLTIVS